MQKYIPPSKKRGMPPPPQKIDINNEKLFPSLELKDCTKNEKSDWSFAIKEDDAPEIEVAVENEKEPLKYVQIKNPHIRTKWDNYINRYIECPNIRACGRLVDTVCEVVDTIIATVEKNGYAFNNHLQAKKRILHWLFKIEMTDKWVDFEPNYWIVRNIKLRREEDLIRFMECFSSEYWESIYWKWSANNDWLFNQSCTKGEMMCNDFPYMIYSCLNLEYSEMTQIITEEIREEEEEEARCIALSHKYRTMIENGEDFTELIKQVQGQKIEQDNLRGDRRFDIW
jgi:hypothetical protein